MTGLEHYAEAERLLAAWHACVIGDSAEDGYSLADLAAHRALLSAAHVHATLAQAERLVGASQSSPLVRAGSAAPTGDTNQP